MSPELQARLERIHDRHELRQWARETGVADKVLELVIVSVRSREGLPTDPRTWRIVGPDEVEQGRGG